MLGKLPKSDIRVVFLGKENWDIADYINHYPAVGEPEIDKIISQKPIKKEGGFWREEEKSNFFERYNILGWVVFQGKRTLVVTKGLDNTIFKDFLDEKITKQNKELGVENTNLKNEIKCFVTILQKYGTRDAFDDMERNTLQKHGFLKVSKPSPTPTIKKKK